MKQVIILVISFITFCSSVSAQFVDNYKLVTESELETDSIRWGIYVKWNNAYNELKGLSPNILGKYLSNKFGGYFLNGIYKTADSVLLGGSLIKNTAISGRDLYSFRLDSISSFSLNNPTGRYNYFLRTSNSSGLGNVWTVLDTVTNISSQLLLSPTSESRLVQNDPSISDYGGFKTTINTTIVHNQYGDVEIDVGRSYLGHDAIAEIKAPQIKLNNAQIDSTINANGLPSPLLPLINNEFVWTLVDNTTGIGMWLPKPSGGGNIVKQIGTGAPIVGAIVGDTAKINSLVAGTRMNIGYVVGSGDLTLNWLGASTTNSVTGNGYTGTPLQLVNDQNAPGNGMYYGTDGSGVKGWNVLPSSGSSYIFQNGLTEAAGNVEHGGSLLHSTTLDANSYNYIIKGDNSTLTADFCNIQDFLEVTLQSTVQVGETNYFTVSHNGSIFQQSFISGTNASGAYKAEENINDQISGNTITRDNLVTAGVTANNNVATDKVYSKIDVINSSDIANILEFEVNELAARIRTKRMDSDGTIRKSDELYGSKKIQEGSITLAYNYPTSGNTKTDTKGDIIWSPYRLPTTSAPADGYGMVSSGDSLRWSPANADTTKEFSIMELLRGSDFPFAAQNGNSYFVVPSTMNGWYIKSWTLAWGTAPSGGTVTVSLLDDDVVGSIPGSQFTIGGVGFPVTNQFHTQTLSPSYQLTIGDRISFRNGLPTLTGTPRGMSFTVVCSKNP